MEEYEKKAINPKRSECVFSVALAVSVHNFLLDQLICLLSIIVGYNLFCLFSDKKNSTGIVWNLKKGSLLHILLNAGGLKEQ